MTGLCGKYATNVKGLSYDLASSPSKRDRTIPVRLADILSEERGTVVSSRKQAREATAIGFQAFQEIIASEKSAVHKLAASFRD